MKKGKELVRIGVALFKDDYEILKEISEQEQRKVSNLIRIIINNHINVNIKAIEDNINKDKK